ncbi:MAG: ABC transporter permease, partial [Rhodospirillales bacterium]|nr:ABC transporter permease [Rhodospirillales bacterium]
MSAGPIGSGLPRWANIVVLPAVNLMAAFLVSGLVVLIIGENPLEVVQILIWGAFGFEEAIGYTLFYTTNFIFTGLAVAIAFHCMLFNIGGEGQAYIGGLGITLVGLNMGWLPPIMLVPLCVIGAGLFGAAWAFIPAYLQAKRGSHIVITTIMFNFIASSVMVYLLVNVLIRPGQMQPESREFAEAAIPFVHEALAWIGIEFADTPWNLSFLWALVCAVFVWAYVWHTRWGYQLRTTGTNPTAASYAGISESRNIIMTMCISGALAGFLGLNEIMGYHHRLLLHFSGGYGFVG